MFQITKLLADRTQACKSLALSPLCGVDPPCPGTRPPATPGSASLMTGSLGRTHPELANSLCLLFLSSALFQMVFRPWSAGEVEILLQFSRPVLSLPFLLPSTQAPPCQHLAHRLIAGVPLLDGITRACSRHTQMVVELSDG